MLGLLDDIVTTDLNLAGMLMEEDYREQQEQQRLAGMLGGAIGSITGDGPQVFVDGQLR